MSNMKIEDIMHAPLEQLSKAQSVAIMQGFLLTSGEASIGKPIRDRPVVLCWGENFSTAPDNPKAASSLAAGRQAVNARRKDVVVVVLKDDPDATVPRQWPARPMRGALALWQQQRVATYIRENIGTSLRSAELAAFLRLSNSHFIRTFKASFGESPVAYITRQRVLYAQEIMLSTDNSLSEVALACGWCDQSHFTRAFHRMVRVSPGAWRRQHGFASVRKDRSAVS